MTVGASLLLLLDAKDCLDEEGRAWLEEHAPQLARVGVARPAELLARLRERLGAGWTPTPATVAFLARAGVPVTDLTPHLRTCLVCGGQVETESGTRTQTAGGTCFDTPGHYGSTAFDPDDGTSLSIAVCDPCPVARSDRVLHVAADDTPGRGRPPTPSGPGSPGRPVTWPPGSVDGDDYQQALTDWRTRQDRKAGLVESLHDGTPATAAVIETMVPAETGSEDELVADAQFVAGRLADSGRAPGLTVSFERDDEEGYVSYTVSNGQASTTRGVDELHADTRVKGTAAAVQYAERFMDDYEALGRT